jgi:hypothetical protein
MLEVLESAKVLPVWILQRIPKYRKKTLYVELRRQFGFNVQRSRYAEGVPGNRRASVVGSYTHADIDTTQIFSFSGRRLSEREKCHPDSQNVHG